MIRDDRLDLKVFEAAAAVQAVPIDACYQVAINAAATTSISEDLGQEAR